MLNKINVLKHRYWMCSPHIVDLTIYIFIPKCIQIDKLIKYFILSVEDHSFLSLGYVLSSYRSAPVIAQAFFLEKTRCAIRCQMAVIREVELSESFWNRSSPFLLIQFVIQAVHSLYCQSGDRHDSIKARETHRRDERRWLSEDQSQQTFVLMSAFVRILFWSDMESFGVHRD